MSRIPFVIALNWRILKENTTRHPPKSPVQTQTPPIRPYETPKHPLTPQTQSPFFQEQPWLLQSTCQTVWGAFELSKDVRRDSGRNEGVKRCLLSVRNVFECLRLPLVMSWICQGWYRSVSGYLRVSVGSWRAYGGLRGVFGSLFPSFAFNSRKSQIRFVTFSSRPSGPRCLKYQNVPELR